MKRVAPLIVLLLLLTACLPTTGSEPIAGGTTETTTRIATPTLQITSTPTPDFVATTPAPMCTPPPCTDNEIYTCPGGGCFNGCGTVCATVTPPSPSDFGSVPDDWDGLQIWLQDNYSYGTLDTAVRAALLDAGWLTTDDDWQTSDFTGDDQPEWAMLLYPPETSGEEYRFPGNIWVINANGLVYKQWDTPSDMGFSLQLQLLPAADFTGDAIPELVINEESCGAHTCYTGIQVFIGRNGRFTNIVQPPDNPDFAAMISVSYADTRYEDFTGDGVLDILVHGGGIGSAGAGIPRTSTEVWAWDGTTLQRVETVLDATEYRHHILYEANDNYNNGDLDAARTLYEQAINDPALINEVFFPSPEETYDAIVQFATFRLMLIDLQEGLNDNAANQLATLQQSYPDAPLTEAAATLLAQWSGAENLPTLCGTITATLETSDNPTGALSDLGYGNPYLTAVHVCPHG